MVLLLVFIVVVSVVFVVVVVLLIVFVAVVEVAFDSHSSDAVFGQGTGGFPGNRQSEESARSNRKCVLSVGGASE